MTGDMKIVSLCPSLTELVFDLGRGADLVGVTEWCIHPAAGVASIEKVGGTKNPEVERICELAPDLVLMNEEENRREDAELLAASGLAIHTSFPRTVEETAEMVRSIGAALERSEAAAPIAADILARAARVRAAAEAAAPVRWTYLIWRKPWMAVNGDTFTDALLSLAGGVNVFGEHAERFPTVTADDLRTARPDVVLLCTEPFPFADKHADELAEATGIDRERFVIADGEYLSWHGSRTPDGVDYAARLIDEARAR